MAQIVDADSHLIEMPELYRDNADPADRWLALRFSGDELGYDCLFFKGKPIMECHLTIPGDRSTQGGWTERRRLGLPADHSIFEEMPEHYYLPSARRDFLAEWGADQAILFPNSALIWERALRGELEALQVNMAAWNRWAVTVQQEGAGKLHPVGMVVLEDLAWVEAQLRALAAGGVRAVKAPLGLAAGKRLSHPDLDRVWSLFEELDLALVFHVGASYNRPLEDAWTEDDHAADRAPLLGFAIMASDVQLVLADLVLHGVLERHPRLRIGVMELMVDWLAMFLARLDTAPRAHESFTGRGLYQLAERPSDYVRRQVRVGAFAAEKPADRIAEIGPILMFSGDFPHSEGEPSLAAYRAKAGAIPAEHADGFWGANAQFLLGQR
ncbi:MAG: amidohydrolase family protein [Acidimicrobiales bacterium]